MKYLKNEPLRKHTSFKIGGPADYFCVVTDLDELREALAFSKDKKLKVFILGAGSNLLIADHGLRGLVIKVAFSWIKQENKIIRVGAGVPLTKLLKHLTERELTGLEFLAGVPGSIGGAVVMNAGAWDENISRYVQAVLVVDQKGREKILNNKQLGFRYRKSKLQSGKLVVVEVVLKLLPGKKTKIKEKIKANLALRRAKQPLDKPSCGSVFKNPRGKHAGYLIEQAGLRGLRVGDAEVSKKHGNFLSLK